VHKVPGQNGPFGLILRLCAVCGPHISREANHVTSSRAIFRLCNSCTFSCVIGLPRTPVTGLTRTSTTPAFFTCSAGCGVLMPCQGRVHVNSLPCCALYQIFILLSLAAPGMWHLKRPAARERRKGYIYQLCIHIEFMTMANIFACNFKSLQPALDQETKGTVRSVTVIEP
jgi:hypothetical protein